jgi:predicted nucleotidyltransferase
MLMFPLPPASTAALPLSAVLARLSRHPAVDGLVLVGSAARAALTAASDYDLLVVLAELPPSLHVGITTIDHRITDLLFASAAQIDAIVASTTALDGAAWEGRIARWLVDGQIAHDVHGRLGRAQQKVRTQDWIRPLAAIDSYGAWIGVNYNLLHTRRLLQSDDPVYRAAGELRITLYGVSSVLYSYFQVRRLYWEGDKAAIRYLMTSDPAAFALLQQLLREPDPDRRFAAYEQFAALALAPIGELWEGEATVLWSDAVPATWESIDQGVALWEDLLADRAQVAPAE